MFQKPIVYVSRVTNLSDARYCAGMGTELLGFVVDPSDPDYVSPEAYREFVSWISGPSRVIEIGSAVQDLQRIMTAYAPEFLHVDWKHLGSIPEGIGELIVEIPYDKLDSWGPRNDIKYCLVSGSIKGRIKAPNGAQVMVDSMPEGSSVPEFLEQCGATGIALRGSKEVSPGLKDYDHLSRVLEELNG